MKIVIAPDSYKGSLSAKKVAEKIKAGFLKKMTNAEIVMTPLADGGEGTVEALVNATEGNTIKTKAKDPLDREIDTYFGILGDGKTAVIETAAASGLALLEEDMKNPLLASSKGTGQLIKEALDHNCNHIILGLGGSGINDAGAGMLQALGMRLLDMHGYDLHPGAADLINFDAVDFENFDDRLKNTKITLAGDVNNPLCGDNGASKIYGPQKGADPAMADMLDQNLYHFGTTLEKITGKSLIDTPGSGAAGGIAVGLLAFTDASMQSGVQLVIEYTGLHNTLQNTDILITGEGCLDRQTKFGKAPAGAAEAAGKAGAFVIGIAGALGEGYKTLYETGFDALFSIIDKPQHINEAMQHTETRLLDFSENLAGFMTKIHNMNT